MELTDPKHKDELLDQEVPTQAVKALREALGERLVAVVLFGSRARGDATADSDWDLLVLAEDLPQNLFDRSLFLKGALSQAWRGAVAVVARTPQEFETYLPSLYLDIALDGQVLYDPRGYAAGRLATLKGMIEEAGLYRVRTQAGDLWRWKSPPAGAWVLEWQK